jgi:hypothetical protein
MPVELSEVDLSQAEERRAAFVHARIPQVYARIVVTNRKK